jgi:large subunit ribosomal protein L7/L12
LLETADLIQTLKTKLNISEVAAPVAAAGVAPAAGSADATPAAAEEPEKSVFNLKLISFDAASKAKIIREVKAMLGLNLVDAKKFVESAPKVLKEGVTKEDAEKIKKALEAVGGKVDLE